MTDPNFGREYQPRTEPTCRHCNHDRDTHGYANVCPTGRGKFEPRTIERETDEAKQGLPRWPEFVFFGEGPMRVQVFWKDVLTGVPKLSATQQVRLYDVIGESFGVPSLCQERDAAIERATAAEDKYRDLADEHEARISELDKREGLLREQCNFEYERAEKAEARVFELEVKFYQAQHRLRAFSDEERETIERIQKEHRHQLRAQIVTETYPGRDNTGMRRDCIPITEAKADALLDELKDIGPLPSFLAVAGVLGGKETGQLGNGPFTNGPLTNTRSTEEDFIAFPQPEVRTYRMVKKEELDAANKRIAELERERGTAHNEVAEELEATQEEQKRLRAKCSRQRKELRRLNQKQRNMLAACAGLALEAIDRDEHVVSLQNELSALRAEKDKTAANNATLRHMNDELQIEVAGLKEKLEALRANESPEAAWRRALEWIESHEEYEGAANSPYQPPQPEPSRCRATFPGECLDPKCPEHGGGNIT